MKLELGKIFIHDVQFAERTYVENGTLYICRQEVIDLVLEDDRLVS
ncbi:beta-aspartyl-peptidase, partial [[Clostridium] symbiosum]|nr:beta-aspartyl-peptidase [[Clostridium] symbiosum]